MIEDGKQVVDILRRAPGPGPTYTPGPGPGHHVSRFGRHGQAQTSKRKVHDGLNFAPAKGVVPKPLELDHEVSRGSPETDGLCGVHLAGHGVLAGVTH